MCLVLVALAALEALVVLVALVGLAVLSLCQYRQSWRVTQFSPTHLPN